MTTENKVKSEKIFKIIKRRFQNADLGSSAVLIAYYLLLSIFPMGIAAGNILSLFEINPAGLTEYIRIIVPAAIIPILEPIIENVLTTGSGGMLSLGAIGLLWSASRGVNHLQNGMNKTYGVSKQGSYLIKRLISIAAVFFFILFLFAFLLIFSVGTIILDSLVPFFAWAQTFDSFLTGFKWPVTFLFLFTLLAFIYTFIPDVKIKFKQALPGAVFATLGLAGLVQAFSIYLRFATKKMSSYGTMSAFFLLMFWMNIMVIIILLGSLLNACISEYYHGIAEAKTERVRPWVRQKILPKVPVKIFGVKTYKKALHLEGRNKVPTANSAENAADTEDEAAACDCSSIPAQAQVPMKEAPAKDFKDIT